MKKLLSLIIIVAFLLSFAVINVSAACSLSVTPSKSTIYVGDTVTVTLSFTGSESIESITGSVNFKSSKLEYKGISGGFGNPGANLQGENILISDYYLGEETMPKTYSVKLTFKAKAVGDTEVKVTSSTVGGPNDSSIGAPTESTTISVKQENKSSNANLKWLTVPSGCTLVPKFSKDVTNYTCTVPGSVTSFPMDWEAEDSKATTKVSTGYQLKVGENTRTVTVTAQDGTKKVYTVKITRLQPEATPTKTPTVTATPTPTQEPMNVTIDGTDYIIRESVTLIKPDGYEQSAMVYGGREIEVAVLNDITIVQLSDGQRDSFFVYDVENHSFSALKLITGQSVTYTALDEKPLSLPEDLQGQHKVLLDGEYTVWPLEQFGEGYFIVHIMNSLGEKYPAVYCEADGSIQKLSLKIFDSAQTNNTVEPTKKPLIDFSNLNIDWMLVAIIVGAMILVAIIVIIIVLLAKNGKEKKEEAPNRKWGFEDPYDINIEEMSAENQSADDDEDFS